MWRWEVAGDTGPGSSDGKESACNAGDLGLIPGSGRSPGEGNGNQLQYSCLENPMGGGGVWRDTVHGVTKNMTPLSDFTFTFLFTFIPIGGASGKESARQCGRHKRHGVRSLDWEDPLKKEMATHSSVLAWKIPWMEKPGGLQSMRWQRVEHD